MKLIEAIAQNTRLLVDEKFAEHAEIRQKRIMKALPSGSGFDCGTRIVNANDSTVILETDFHHMDENGFYCGWTKHKIRISASLIHGFTVYVFGQNKNEIKGYISDVFNSVLSSEFEWMNKA